MQVKLVAVTACPTGIAHTYMAAEKLKTTAEALGVALKIETNGSIGVKNSLSAEDIKEATAVIIAADAKVEMERFKGKPLIQASVTDGINRARFLIERAMSGNLPVYKGSSLDIGTEPSKHPIFQRFYKPLLNGIGHAAPIAVISGLFIAGSRIGGGALGDYFFDIGSFIQELFLPILAAFIAYSIADRQGFIGGLIGGFLVLYTVSFLDHVSRPSGVIGALLIGFIAGYTVKGLSGLLSKLPKSWSGIVSTTILPLFSTLLIVLLVIAINRWVHPVNKGFSHLFLSLDDHMVIRVLLGALLAGLMAYDMGGPINKLAYAFGVITMAFTYSNVMAAVMVGGMVPPLGLALATTLFRRRFDSTDKQLGRDNYLKGLSFITEGAIPFAKKYPKATFPAILIGSSVAGGIAMGFNVKTPTPLGGIFVVPLMEQFPFFLFALLMGSLLTAFIAGQLILLDKGTTNEGA